MNINFTINRNKGFEKSTNFYFSINPSIVSSIKAVKWSFDDGNEAFSSFETQHSYLTEGEYNPKVFVYTDSTMISATSSIKVVPFIDESIYFDIVPPPSFAGHFNRYPFEVHITSKITDPHYIDLSTMFSRSYKHQEIENKWSFLRPEWRFLDLDGNIVDRIKTEDTLIKIDDDGNITENGTVVGVSGKAYFYFVDDIYNHDLSINNEYFTTIIATLDTTNVPAKIDYDKTKTYVAGFGNSKAVAIFPYQINPRIPNELKITENGIQPHLNPRWSDIVTPVLVNPIYGSEFPDEWIDGNGHSKIYKPVESFTKFFPISDEEIPLSLGLTNLTATYDPSDVKFVYEIDGYKSAGYYKGKFYTDSISALNAQITASVNLSLPNLSSIYIYPILWVSNPNAKTLNSVQYFRNSFTDSLSTKNLNKAQIHTFEIDTVTPENYTTMTMNITGFHGVYSMAVTPYPDYHVWASDSENNKLYRFSTNGKLLCSIDLQKIVTENRLGYLVDKQVSPASIVLDSQKNIWMTLYDSVSTLKFDSAGNFLFAIHPLSSLNYTIPPNINNGWYSDIQYFESSITEDGGNNFIEPTGIDSDISDNVWISYSSFLSAYAIKYNSSGIIQKVINFPLSSCPQEIVCDNQSNVWVLQSNILWGDMGKIEKFDTNGNKLSSFEIRHPNHASIDNKQNLWFTFDYDKIGKISNSNSNFVYITLSSKDIGNYNPDYWFDKSENIDDNIFEGICTDLRNNVYIINSIENQIYIIDQDTLEYKDRFMVNPQGMTQYLKYPDGYTEEFYNPINKSLQAQGDWSGFRWINKYMANKSPYGQYPKSITITGSSLPLNYYIENPYSVYKINENFDLTQYIKNFSFIPVIENSTYLFEKFLPAIYGKENSDDLGVKLYEKISNFLINHSDIDTCNLEQLYNLSEMVDMNSDDFVLNYPENIKRLINLASINESVLWGNLNEKEINIPQLITNNDPIDTTYFMVTAGYPMVLKTKSLGTYRLIQTGPIYNQNIYSIVYLATSLGLDARDWRSDYEFYTADYWKSQSYMNNIIDWNNQLTNISPVLSSSVNDWSSDQGILETMFSYYLFKGLDFVS